MLPHRGYIVYWSHTVVQLCYSAWMKIQTLCPRVLDQYSGLLPLLPESRSISAILDNSILVLVHACIRRQSPHQRHDCIGLFIYAADPDQTFAAFRYQLTDL